MNFFNLIQNQGTWVIDNKIKATCFGFIIFLSGRYIILKLHRKWKSYPPGPVGLPFIGYFAHRTLWFVYKIEYYGLRGIVKRYGDITMYYTFINTPPFIIIANASLAKQILSLKPQNKSHILNRPKIYPNTVEILSNDDDIPTLAQVQYNEWKKRRKLSQNALFSMCNSSYINNIIDNIMQKTIFPHIDKIIENKNELWYPRKLMNYCAFNTIFHSSFGRSVHIDDKSCIELRHSIDDTFRALTNIKCILWNAFGNKISFGNWLTSKLYPYEVTHIRHKRCNLIRKLIKQREYGEYDKNNPTSFIDHMLKALELKQITRSELEADVGAMFAAGSDTTTSALEHAIIFAAKYIDIQDKVRNELLLHFGDNKTKNNKLKFDITKLSKLSIFRAFIKEVLRVACVATSGLPHCASDNIWVEHKGNQYKIAKNSTVIYKIDSVHYNEKENWIDSSKRIVLENWLDDNGVFRLNKSEMTFGFGYRDCVGKLLANKELHIVIGYLLLNYSFVLKNKEQEIKSMDKGILVIHPQIGVIVMPL
eukprot:101412_1